MKKHIINFLVVLGLFLLLIGIPKISGLLANQFDLSQADPDGAYLWISLHHIFQALIFIPLFVIVKKIKPEIHFGIGIGDYKLGLSYVTKFTLFFLGYTAVGFAIVLLSGTFQPFQYPMNARNIFGYLGFQLLLSGPSEELLFRSFGMAVLGYFIGKRVFKGKLSVSNIIIAVIFGLAHVGFSFSPFELRYSAFQVIYAFALGLLYGDCIERTKSVIYPMMLHSISNVIAVGVTVLVTALNI